jgi:hypothetical protein
MSGETAAGIQRFWIYSRLDQSECEPYRCMPLARLSTSCLDQTQGTRLPACSTDLDALCEQIVHNEPLISDARRPQLRRLLLKLIEKQVRTGDVADPTMLQRVMFSRAVIFRCPVP